MRLCPVPWTVLFQSILLAALAQSAFAQTLYSGDGSPTALEEAIRWRVNRGRFDTASENKARGTSYSDVPASSGPLAPNQSLTLAARHHSEDMATHNVFQHATVPGSAYYDSVTQPDPWDRMKAEGYSWNNAGENIAAGYSGAEAAYAGWWKSTGHRQNMYNAALREIGNGYFNSASSTYRNYYTMDLGTSGKTRFFTDTLFLDASGNGAYDEGEGVGSISINLNVAGTPTAANDIATSVGSFAVPIQSIVAGATVQVVLSNTSGGPVTLSVPRNFSTLAIVTLAPGEARPIGTFQQLTTARNFGLRDLVHVTPSTATPKLRVQMVDTGSVLKWSSEQGASYQPQWTSDFVTWNSFLPADQAGTGGEMTYSDYSTPAPGKKFYRLLIRKP